MKFIRKIEEAIIRGEIHIYFQSQYLFKNNTLHLNGVEALIRWHCNDGTIVKPDTLIKTLESNGGIHTIGYFVLQEACKTLQDWSNNEKLKDLHISINVSPLQLKDFDFLNYLKDCISKYSFDVEKLNIEITENAPIKGTHCYKILKEISDLGIGISLDDFGTENSSLNVLLNYPISEIKIDKEFISSENPITDSSQTKQIIQSINDISKSFDCSVIAEGVESLSQFRALLDIGICRFQGFLFSKPSPKKIFEKHVNENGNTHDISYLL